MKGLFKACLKTLRTFPWVDDTESDRTVSGLRNWAMESPGVIVNSQQASTRLISGQNNRMEKGECALVLVRANVRWNHTGLFVKKGEEYQFFVLPDQWWLDAGIPSTADGYRCPLIEWWMSLGKNLKHLPEAKWMALGGAIGEDDTTAFLIGKSRSDTIDRDGELICFANDARWFFWNNIGRIWVSILRVN